MKVLHFRTQALRRRNFDRQHYLLLVGTGLAGSDLLARAPEHFERIRVDCGPLCCELRSLTGVLIIRLRGLCAQSS